MDRFRVGVLGATGLVGQRLAQRLSSHPWFEIAALAASERSAGRPYGEVVRWALGADPPGDLADMVIRPCVPSALEECDLVLSGLDAAAAHEIEPQFSRSGFPVVSNSSAMRLNADVPIVVPEVNASHLAIVESKLTRGKCGFVVTNPNCSVAGLVMALAPLHRARTVTRVVVTTLQAVSGAGLEGPRALDLVDNVIPWIAGEEEKIEGETGKILGEVDGERVLPAPLSVAAHCHRVATLDGHLEAVSVELASRLDPEEAAELLTSFRGEIAGLELPSAPTRPILVRAERDRPQPRLDRCAGEGMAVVVGRIRRCPVLSLRLEILSHNTVRGAAGGTVLNAELLVARGLVGRRSGR